MWRRIYERRCGEERLKTSRNKKTGGLGSPGQGFAHIFRSQLRNFLWILMFEKRLNVPIGLCSITRELP
jgi:hypothetical protein